MGDMKQSWWIAGRAVSVGLLALALCLTAPALAAAATLQTTIQIKGRGVVHIPGWGIA